MTERKPAATALTNIPLLVDRLWIKHHLRLGDSKIKEMETAGILKPVEVPGLSNKRYRSVDVLSLLGYTLPDEATT